MIESFPKKRRTQLLLIAAVLLLLAAFAPSYSYVRVTGGAEDIEVQSAGFGVQRVQVRTGDAVIESSAGVIP